MKREIEMLMSLGLERSEAEIYTALVNMGPSTVGELNPKTSVSRAKIYSILDKLIMKGWVIEVSSNPRKFMAERPSKKLSSVKEDVTATCDELEKVLEKAYNQAHNRISIMETYSGHSVLVKAREMMSRAEKEIVIVSRFIVLGGYTMEHLLDMYRDIVTEALKRGVEVTIVGSKEDIGLVPPDSGINAYYMDLPGSGFLVVDRKEIIMGARTIVDGEGGEEDIVAVYSTNSYLIDMTLKILEEAILNRARERGD